MNIRGSLPDKSFSVESHLFVEVFRLKTNELSNKKKKRKGKREKKK